MKRLTLILALGLLFAASACQNTEQTRFGHYDGHDGKYGSRGP